jgi:D-glycero-alpha-D-manno-heptose 1-phosphate guanylyltransferase
MEAIILAGGLGTRLRSVVQELPKCLAPVAGKPFLHYIIIFLQKQGVERFIFSLGYKAEAVIKYLQTNEKQLNYTYCIEAKPLGTGGAVQLAMEQSKANNVLVTNGDSIFECDIKAFAQAHDHTRTHTSIALLHKTDFDRYGVVEINDKNQITAFKEKQYTVSGFINTGVYLLNREAFLKNNFPKKFSLEKDYFEKQVGSKQLMGFEAKGYFIDIGIPADYTLFTQKILDEQ